MLVLLVLLVLLLRLFRVGWEELDQVMARVDGDVPRSLFSVILIEWLKRGSPGAVLRAKGLG